MLAQDVDARVFHRNIYIPYYMVLEIGGSIEVVVRVGEKGRITIPASVRKALGLREGDPLILYIRRGEIVLRPERAVTSEEIKGIIGPLKVDLDEVEDALGRVH